MAENNRLSELENIADKYDEMLRAARGQIFAEVTVAEVTTTIRLCCQPGICCVCHQLVTLLITTPNLH